ncbi:hypothetical protein TYRP_016897 [Tyrophagus putrescentiae]|nr:hypothetical protein TYRP_016897 [Tyrophagus putrescentiae]
MAVPDRNTSSLLFSIGMANIPVNVREAITEPYERARQCLAQLMTDQLIGLLRRRPHRPALLNRRMTALTGLLYAHLLSLVQDYQNFERDPTRYRPNLELDLEHSAFWNVNQMFDDEVEESIWEEAASAVPSICSSSLVIRLREELVDLLQFVYEDICARGLEEANEDLEDQDEDEGDEGQDLNVIAVVVEVHSRVLMEPMLATANRFLRSVQQMMVGLVRCVEEAVAHA